MKKPHREHDRLIRPLIFGLSLFLAIPCSFSLAQAVTPITPSGLDTHIGAPTTLPGGQTVYDITGGTRPGNGPNLFHSFGDFNVPNNNIANFLNDSGLATSNILGRVTGGNISNIFGTIQTTGFGNANLFLMNPAGFLFGPTATVNVGGMMTFSTANYLKLADGVRFNATPTASADLLLSTAPVAAFGFLGSNPGAITVQGSQLTVAEGTGISLVGGNITIQAGTLDNGTVQSAQLSAPGGQINLVSVGKPSKGGGEVVVAGSGQGSGFTPTGFRSMGTINLAQDSTVDVSATASGADAAASVVIRGGQFVMNNSSLETGSTCCLTLSSGNVEVTADQIALSNGSRIVTISSTIVGPSQHIIFNADTFSATDSAISAVGSEVYGGAVTIQGLRGSGTYAHAVSLRNTQIYTSAEDVGGPITIRGDNISLNHTTLSSVSQVGGPITLVSGGGLNIQDSQLNAGGRSSGGTVDLRAGTSINLTSTIIDSTGEESGSITMAAPVISLRSSRLDVSGFFGGAITLTGTKSVSLSNGTVLSGDSFFGAPAGTIQVEAKTVRLTDTQLTTSTSGGPQSVGGSILVEANTARLTNSQILSTATEGHGGTITLEATKVRLTDTQLTTSTSGGPQSVGGSIFVEANTARLTNSQILSTATEGHGGTITLEATKVRLTDTQLTTSTSGGPQSVGGSIFVEANTARLTNSQILSTATEGHGGTITLEATKVRLTDTQLTTSTSGDPQSVGGSITVDASRMRLKNSQILSTATEGHGGTIDIMSPNLHQRAGSVIDTSSQSGTDGTVTINGIIQP